MAILLSIYIIISWGILANYQIKILTGLTAPDYFLNQLIFVVFNFDPMIDSVDTVRAYHSGNRYIVEIHIVLPQDLPLKDAHNIGEKLTLKIEEFNVVERAFVHLDYSRNHNPNSEHKATHCT